MASPIAPRIELANPVVGETVNCLVSGFCPTKSETGEADANENGDEVEEVGSGEIAETVTAASTQDVQTLHTNDAPALASCQAFIESQSMPILNDDDHDDAGIGKDIADEVVKMLKGAPNKLTIDMTSLDMPDWDLHAQHVHCWKIDPHHANDLTLAMYHGADLGPVECLLKD